MKKGKPTKAPATPAAPASTAPVRSPVPAARTPTPAPARPATSPIHSAQPAPAPRRSSTDKTRIFLVDDHPLLRKGLGELINQQPDLTICGEAEDAPEALRAIEQIKPDLVIVDISLKSQNGIELIKNIKVVLPSAQILVLSMHDESIYALRVLKAGAKAYVMKQEVVDKVMEAIRRIRLGKVFVSERVAAQMLDQVVDGGNPSDVSPVENLSDRELEIVNMIGNGKQTREIATALSISVKTVESHRAHIKDKLRLQNATQLVQWSVRWVEGNKGAGTV